MGKSRYFLWSLTGAAAALTAAAYVTYRGRRRVALARMAEGSQVIETARGPLECAVLGEGPAVLVLHGGGGGYPSCLPLVDSEAGFRYIIPSRPGYLRTPLETGRSPEEQADACAALLDALGVKKAAVWGMSGGGPAAIHFALRHPRRCWALVLLSAINQPVPPFPSAMQFILCTMRAPDFIPWLLLGTPLRDLLVGRRFWQQVGGSVEKRSMYHRLMESLYLFSRSLPGILNDMQCIAEAVCGLEEVHAPTLVLHGDSDTVVPYANGERAAIQIPGARFVTIPGGDHLCYITHLEITRPAVYEFLKAHVPPPAAKRRSQKSRAAGDHPIQQ